MRFLACIFTGWALFVAAAQAETDASDGARAWIMRAVEQLCPDPSMTSFDAPLALSGIWLLDEQFLPNQQQPRRVTRRFALPMGGELRVERRLSGGVQRQFIASVYLQGASGPVPTMQASADGACTIRAGRSLRREGEAWLFLDQLDADLMTVRWTETLQAPWPTGSDEGGIRVGLVDTGLAYDLPQFRDRLARTAAGEPLGFDFWDMDPWPYDGDMGRGPFLPIRHGTAVASVLVKEAPTATLIPYRFPRPDMGRMRDLVERAETDGVRVLAVPLGSNRAEDWSEFVDALAKTRILAVVSAGNDGRDIEQLPVYPAAFDHPNIIKVTSSDDFGRLAQGSNWGGNSIDIMLPAENLSVTDFRGAKVAASGSSYAVPRLTAIAVRILSEDPELSLEELRTRIFALATPSPFERDGVVARGWIPDPLAN